MPDNVAVHGLVIHPATGKLNLVVDGKTGSAGLKLFSDGLY